MPWQGLSLAIPAPEVSVCSVKSKVSCFRENVLPLLNTSVGVVRAAGERKSFFFDTSTHPFSLSPHPNQACGGILFIREMHRLILG